MGAAARQLVPRLAPSGLCGLGFVLEAATGTAYLIEMNPRCTQLGHISLPEQGDLAGVLQAKLTGRSDRGFAPPIDGEVIAFFPQSISASSPADLQTPVYRDVPREYPELVEELLKPPWPDRQLIARLYHRFRPPRPVPRTVFAGGAETPDPMAPRRE